MFNSTVNLVRQLFKRFTEIFSMTSVQYLVLFLVAVLATLSQAVLQAPLLHVTERIEGQYLVKIKPGYDVDTVVGSLREDPLFDFVHGRVDSVFKTAVHGFAATLPDKALELVRRLSWVEYVTEDGIVRAMYDVDSWGLDRIDQVELPLDSQYNPLYHGDGATVYVIDTGVTPTHEDVVGRCEVGADYVDPTPREDYGLDCNGHGSHCSGVAGGTLYGVAKHTNLVGVRVLGCLGSGSTAGVVGGMDWVAANAIKPAVASMSLGGGANQMTDAAVLGMKNAGVLVVVAAGNSNEDACGTSPARSPHATTVGATSIDDSRASYSNYGPCVDIFAPGTLIKSIWRGGDNSTRTVSGTSMACPHVAGAAALYYETQPGASPGTAHAYLVNTATPGMVIGHNGPDEHNRLLKVAV